VSLDQQAHHRIDGGKMLLGYCVHDDGFTSTTRNDERLQPAPIGVEVKVLWESIPTRQASLDAARDEWNSRRTIAT
jgi:hypothetical protein